MCIVLKYGIWNPGTPDPQGVNALVSCGYKPLAAMVLAARGIAGGAQASAYLDCSAELIDPYAMTDMDKAVDRIRRAAADGEIVAVFGDYDVDGITATCLLTDFLRGQGIACLSYIPGRLEEGYGLTPIAINQLHSQGVSLIITVDCGITASEEAQLCKQLGIDLVITDHHECKDILPEAVAVIDPHRPDGGYPHKSLSGVGVAFKLAAAICGDQNAVLEEYCDIVCLGTVADVMSLQGENRVFVAQGLNSLRGTKRPGISALMEECGCDSRTLTATSLGFMLAPRINAAGRMGQIALAIELFLTNDPEQGRMLAQALCELNRQRQAVESEIYDQTVSMLPDTTPEAIVLADDRWHQGVVGIVASRIAEEYACPTFLICLDGDHGKASSRSYGGFNLFAALPTLSPLLESYGGHELAAGFTIHKDNIDRFQEQICQLVAKESQEDFPRTVLDIDCAVPPEMLTLSGIQSLDIMEPCGNGCPKPVLMMENLTVERLRPVGNGKHLRLRLRRGNYGFNAIFFSATPESASISQGDLVDVAFLPQINEFREELSVQMNVQDIRPACKAECSPELFGYHGLRSGAIDPEQAAALLPDRATLGIVWRYLSAVPGGSIREMPMCLCRKIVRWSGASLSLGRMLTCLDIFSDVGLLKTHWLHNSITIQLTQGSGKAKLTQSRTMQILEQKRVENYGNL